MTTKPPTRPSAPVVPADPDADLLVPYTAGQVVFREGEKGREMFIVESGEVEILRRSHGGREERVAVLGSGDFFGEMSLLEGLPRSATARCVGEARLLPIDAATFDRILRQYPEITIRILRSLSSRLRGFEDAEHRARVAAAGVLAGAKRPARAIDVDAAAASPPTVLAAATPPAGAAPQVAARGAFRLVHTASGREFPLAPDQESTIGRFDPTTGRHPEVDLHSLDVNRSLSRQHAHVDCRGGRAVLVEGIGTVNGTWVNGERLASGRGRELHDGDRVRVGAVELVFREAR